MRVVLVLFAVLSVALTGVAAATGLPSWRLTPTGVQAQLRGLSAVSARVAWASGTEGTVLRTVDGGRSWASVGPPSTGELEFRDIEAFGAGRAVVLSIGPGGDSRIYRTDDAGAHWRQTFTNPDPAAFYDCLAFFDPWRGLAMSDPVDGRFRMQTTSDGGRSWRQLPGSAFPPALPAEAGFAASGQCVSTSGPFDAWLATGGGVRARVLHSGDGGRHWIAADTPLPSSASAGVFAVAFRTPRQGVAIGGDYATPDAPGPAVALSGDRGRSWHTPPRYPAGYRSGLAWRGGTVFAVGPGGSDFSRDGGRSWTQFDSGSFDTVDCTGTGACWASGVDGRLARLAF
ncbi:WD40/YVTN/BNR-like repeat-containing protein [Amycolatopsis jiangsuensis]|uniref:WD40/YVTN/BNR-like repeat-containing protein n=1 Tax=Amycolatopsis jiangsuensis TaxID=1181879 RepID=UPI001C8721EB|nr:oxidoreductase [Amycolatopsis jiangsuensis]